MSSNHQRRRSWPRRLRQSHRGVSEIIGTILTVSITVILFAGIMLYVGTMPQPRGTTSTSFAGQTTYNKDSGYTFINITQMGGQQLSNSDTRVLITVNGGQLGDFSLANGGLTKDWAPGMTWALNRSGIGETANIQAIIYQKSVGDIIWQGSVSDSDAAKMPLISNKGMWDGNYVYNSPIFNNQTVRFFVLFASTQDIQYLDTSSVTMDGSSIGLSASIHLIKDASNQFMYASTPYTAAYEWTGLRVAFNFTTTDGREGPVVYSVLNVLANPSGENSAGNNVDPTPKMMVNSMNGYAVFERNDWLVNKYAATPCYSFTLGQKMVFVVASQSVENLKSDSSIYFYDTTTGNVIAPASSPTYKFKFLEYTGSYYVFNVTVNTQSLSSVDRLFPVKISLADGSQPIDQAIIRTNISVGSQAGQATIRTYQDQGMSISKTVFDASDKIFVKIIVPSGTGVWDPTQGSMYISSYDGSMQVRAQPGGAPGVAANGVVFYMQKVGYEYYFHIDLANSSQDVWPLGTNWYTLAYESFTTSNSIFYVSWSITINSPRFTYDLGVASGPMSDSANGLSSILQFYRGDYRWMRFESLISPFDISDPNGQPFNPPEAGNVRVADVDGDSMNEVAVYTASSNYQDIEVYDYFQGDWWARTSIILGGKNNFPLIVDFQMANLDYDNDLDLIYALGDGTVFRVINQGTYWSQLPMLSPSVGTIKGLLATNLTATNGISKGCSVIVYGTGGGVVTYTGAYKAGPVDTATGPKRTLLTLPISSSSTLNDMSAYLSSTARAKFFAIDSKGKVFVNMYWTGTALSTANGTINTSIIGAIAIVPGKFIGTSYVDLCVATTTSLTFIKQTSENTFFKETGTIESQGTISDIAACDFDGNGFDDIVFSDNLPDLQLATGSGLLRRALNLDGAVGWWTNASNIATLSTIFGQINGVSVAIKPAATPY